MGILSIISGVLKVVNALLNIAERRGLINAGEAKNFRRTMQENEKVIVKAKQARRALKHGTGDIVSDPDRRDDK